MKYQIIRTKAHKITKEILISGDAHSVKSQIGKEFQADRELEHVQVLEEGFSILALQKDPKTGKMLMRYSA
jgi:hypothetical protein